MEDRGGEEGSLVLLAISTLAGSCAPDVDEELRS